MAQQYIIQVFEAAKSFFKASLAHKPIVCQNIFTFYTIYNFILYIVFENIYNLYVVDIQLMFWSDASSEQRLQCFHGNATRLSSDPILCTIIQHPIRTEFIHPSCHRRSKECLLCRIALSHRSYRLPSQYSDCSIVGSPYVTLEVHGTVASLFPS